MQIQNSNSVGNFIAKNPEEYKEGEKVIMASFSITLHGLSSFRKDTYTINEVGSDYVIMARDTDHSNTGALNNQTDKRQMVDFNKIRFAEEKGIIFVTCTFCKDDEEKFTKNIFSKAKEMVREAIELQEKRILKIDASLEATLETLKIE